MRPATNRRECLQVVGGEEQTVAPRANECLYVTDAFLVGCQGVADVCVIIGSSWGADCVPLASLSAANPGVRGMVAVRARGRSAPSS